LREGVLLTFAIYPAGWRVVLGRVEVVEGRRVVLREVEALRVARLEQLIEARTLVLECRRVRAEVELRVLKEVR
jgi:hypothetical protein